MNPEAMAPFGKALLAYSQGSKNAELIVRRDDGNEAPIPASVFFRQPSQFTPIEKAALGLCRGHVLDVGAGTGMHSLELRRMGHQVTSMDINPEAVSIMKQRSLEDVYCADIFDFKDGSYDTLLMLGHGIGLVETITGLHRFLEHARTLISTDGQLLLDSLDVRATDDPANLAYHETRRKEGRYIGEIGLQFEFEGQVGPFCHWLQVDADTLKEHAASAGWQCETIRQEQSGDHLAKLTRSGVE